MKRKFIHCTIQKTYLFGLYLLLLIQLPVSAQPPATAWALKIGGIDHDYATCMVTDNAGNSYVTGQFTDTVDFNPKGGSLMFGNGSSQPSTFIAKYDNMGGLVWIKMFRNINPPAMYISLNAPTSIDLDGSGNIYLCGIFGNGSVNFSTDPAKNTILSTAVDTRVGYIVKLDNSGNTLWAKIFEPGFITQGRSVKLKIRDYHIYLSGGFDGTKDFNPGAGIYNLTAINPKSDPTALLSDNYICKLDSSGNFRWARQYGGKEYGGLDAQCSVGDFDINGNSIVVTGGFKGKIDFDPGYSMVSTLGHRNFTDMFIMYLDTAGAFTWAKKSGVLYDSTDFINNDYRVISSVAEGTGVLLDSNGNIFLNGRLSGIKNKPGVGISPLWFDLNISNNPADTFYVLTAPKNGVFKSFLAKYDATGNLKWCHNVGAAGTKLKRDLAGDFYINGSFAGDVDFNPNDSNNAYILSSASTTLATTFISKYDSLGKFIWALNYGAFTNNESAEYGRKIETAGIGLDATGNIYTSSNFKYSSEFGKDTSGQTISFTPVPNTKFATYDFAVMKLAQNICLPTSSSFIVTQCDSFVFKDTAYTLSGTYSQLFQNAGGCDSTVTFNLIINHSRQDTIRQTACKIFAFNNQVYTQSGNYLHTFPNAEGCDSNIVLSLTIDTVNTSVAQNNATLTAKVAGATYQWVDCDNNYATIPGATAQAYTAISNGRYAVIITQNGCTDTSVCSSVEVLGIADLGKGNRISLYPNPAENRITVASQKKLNRAAIRIVSLTGQVMMEYSELRGAQFVLDVSVLAVGIYFVEVTDGNEQVRMKLVKE